MKIAKKMLAVVVAIVMVASLSAMAFAAGTPAVNIVLGDETPTTNEDGEKVVYAYVVLKNCIGFKTADLEVKYDTKVLSLNYISTGPDAEAVSKAKFTKADGSKVDNNVNLATNDATPGDIKAAIAFAHELTEKFINEKNKEIKDVNTSEFKVIEMEFKVVDENAASTKIDLIGEAAVGSATVKAEGRTVVLKEVDDTTTAAPETTTAAPTTTEKATAAANPNTGDQKTGDTVALVAVAGVVAVAGAAFVISKKRK